ncbi:MAG TPA: hypothetical protein VE074_13840 [Jatrophihabitantaceae bacterium]|nr:hypothetical protein [Jatrophihabitantaceae bacterium]
MKPTIGQIVYYTSDTGTDQVLAAIVTALDSVHDSVSLYVFHPLSAYGLVQVFQSFDRAGTVEARGKWSWRRALED